MEKIKDKITINYSSSVDVKNYLIMLAKKYNMTISGTITMIIMQHKFQNESLEKLDLMQEMLAKLEGGADAK